MRTAILILLVTWLALAANPLPAMPLQAQTLQAETMRVQSPETRPLPPSDDGWRRTTRGWEHVSAWQTEAATISARSDSQATIDRVCAYVLILSGAAGAVVLLLVEIDPLEFRAFRMRTRR